MVLPSPLVRGEVPALLVGLHADPTFLIAQEFVRRRGGRTAFWVTTTYDAWIRRNSVKERVKHFVFPRVDAVLTTGQDGRNFARRYGASEDQLFILPHFVDYDHFASGRMAAVRDRHIIRGQLGVRGVTFLYVGRLWRGKGIDYLLDAFARLSANDGMHATLLVVGAGPDEARLRRESERRGVAQKVIFAGFHQRDELPRLYTAADVFVFPTLGDPFGHVVEEAMSCRLPVIATSAAGEIRDRIEEGVNGFIVPPRDSAALMERMALLAGDRGLRAQMSKAAGESVAGQTGERWAAEFERVANAIVAR